VSSGYNKKIWSSAFEALKVEGNGGGEALVKDARSKITERDAESD
jgi:hypothetical protein